MAVNRRQPRIHLPLRNRDPGPRASPLLPLQRRNILALLARPLQPRNKIQPLHERKVMHLALPAARLDLPVQPRRRRIVLRDGDVAVQPGEVDTAEVDALLGRGDEARRGGDGDDEVAGVREAEVRRLLEGGGLRVGRGGGGRDRGLVGGYRLPEEEERVLVGGCHGGRTRLGCDRWIALNAGWCEGFTGVVVFRGYRYVDEYATWSDAMVIVAHGI